MREREKIAMVRKLHSNSAPIEEILVFLRKENASRIDSIRLLHLGTGIGLGEAKRIVFLSKTWSDRFASDEAFLDALLRGLDAKEEAAA